MRPQRMLRVAIVAPAARLSEALGLVGDAGCVELDLGRADVERPEVERPEVERPEVERPEVERPDAGQPDAGPNAVADPRAVELARVAGRSVRRGEVAGLSGWVPEGDLPALSGRLERVGAAAVPVPFPRGAMPPTLLGERRPGGSFDLLVTTYATVPYRDVDPTLVAGLAYVAMFGMMFGDAGHGLLLVACGLVARAGRLPGRWRGSAALRRAWPFLVGGGLASVAFGALYGEFFGPTGLPVLWVDPMEQPVSVLVVAVVIGAVLIAGAYALGTVNRVREGGWGYALYARTGVAGSLVFLALALVAAGLVMPDGVPLSGGWVVLAGGLVAAIGLGLAFTGLLVEAGGGAAGVVQAVVELVDLLVRLASNVVSFARLAAFGLVHAALCTVVWQATVALWGSAPGKVAAPLVFLLGNAIAFGLEALIAGIQALRLEYYELFSRIFVDEGRPFRPWRLSPATPSDPEVIA